MSDDVHSLVCCWKVDELGNIITAAPKHCKHVREQTQKRLRVLMISCIFTMRHNHNNKQSVIWIWLWVVLLVIIQHTLLTHNRTMTSRGFIYEVMYFLFKLHMVVIYEVMRITFGPNRACINLRRPCLAVTTSLVSLYWSTMNNKQWLNEAD